jgi:hypothetical protein
MLRIWPAAAWQDNGYPQPHKQILHGLVTVQRRRTIDADGTFWQKKTACAREETSWSSNHSQVPV